MSLDELMKERNNILNELKVYEKIKLELKYNNKDKSSDKKQEIFKTITHPDLEDVTKSSVEKKLKELTDNLSKIYEQINNY